MDTRLDELRTCASIPGRDKRIVLLKVSRPVPRPNQPPVQRLAGCTPDHTTAPSAKVKNVWSRVLFVLPEEQSCYMLKIKHISKGDTKFHQGLTFVVIDKWKIQFINQSTSK